MVKEASSLLLLKKLIAVFRAGEIPLSLLLTFAHFSELFVNPLLFLQGKLFIFKPFERRNFFIFNLGLSYGL